MTPLELFTETGEVLISYSKSTISNKVAVALIKTTDSPYPTKKNTPIAGFSVVTPGQSKYNKPVDMVFLSVILKSDPDLTAYSNELLKTTESEQQKNVFCFPTPEKAGKPEDHPPTPTRTLKQLFKLREKKT